jgi:hypothetical protein
VELLAARVAGDEARAEAVRQTARGAPARRRRQTGDEGGLAGQVDDLLRSRVAQQVGREVVRGLVGLLRKRL